MLVRIQPIALNPNQFAYYTGRKNMKTAQIVLYSILLACSLTQATLMIILLIDKIQSKHP